MPRHFLAGPSAPLSPRLSEASPGLTADEIGPRLIGHTVEEVERELILRTLNHHDGNRTRSAHALGISVRTLRNKISEYAALGIVVPEPGQFRREHRGRPI